MKRLIETDEGGMEQMMGKEVLIVTSGYFYAGRLSGVNANHVELSDPMIVYDTGLDSDAWGSTGSLPSPWRVQIAAIESWGAAKC